MLKEFYSQAKAVNGGKPLVVGGKAFTASQLLCSSFVDNPQSLFKITMKAKCNSACALPLTTMANSAAYNTGATIFANSRKSVLGSLALSAVMRAESHVKCYNGSRKAGEADKFLPKLDNYSCARVVVSRN